MDNACGCRCPTVLAMRWDRLFAELEASTLDEQAAERDALAEDLQDEQWAALSWTDLLGDPHVRLEVAGLGEVSGPVVGAGDVIVLQDDGRRVVVVPEAVCAVSGDDGRAAGVRPLSRTRSQIARALRDAGVEVTVVRRSGSPVAGTIAAVGADFIQVESGRRRVSLPWSSIAALLER